MRKVFQTKANKIRLSIKYHRKVWYLDKHLTEYVNVLDIHRCPSTSKRLNIPKKMHEYYYFGWLETENFEMKICDLCKLMVFITLFLKWDWIGWFSCGICLHAFTCVYQNDMQLYRNANAGVKLVSVHAHKQILCLHFVYSFDWNLWWWWW